MSHHKNFIDKTILITGSSSGMGKAIALRFASLSASVVITGKSEEIETIKSVADECRSFCNKKVIEVIADLTIDDDVKRLIKTTIDEFGKIDVLVNNAGISALNKISSPNLMEIYSQIMNTNVRSIVLLTSLAVPYLEKTKGNIINISSIAAMIPDATRIYCLSKCALNMFTQCLALELGPKGIRVNCVNPGLTRTPMFASVGITEESERRFSDAIPLRRIGDPKDVAKAVEFLASDDASFITGILMPVDGGGLLTAFKLSNFSK